MSRKAVLPLEEQVEREKELVKKRCPALPTLPVALKYAVLGDYLAHRNPNKKVMQVAKSYKACVRLHEVGFADAHLLPLFEEHEGLSRKEMNAVLTEHMRRTHARKQVFATLWEVICEFLNPKDVSSWNEACEFAPVEAVAKFFADRDVQKCACKMLREMPALDPAFDYERSPVFARLWQYVRTYPNYPGHVTHVLVPAIAAFVQEKQNLTPEVRGARITRLRMCLESMGVALRADSRFAQAYVDCTQYCTVEEVAATLYITSKLFSASHIAWSQNHEEFEADLVRTVFTCNVPWIQAATDICESGYFHDACIRGEEEEEMAERRREEYEEHMYERRRRGRYDDFY